MQLHRQIFIGDVLDNLKQIPDESIDTIVSSPPYWGLRDYQVEGQWGSEPDFHDYLKKMGLLMAELKRVLKKTGSCWIDLGDTYGTHSSGEDRKQPAAILREVLPQYNKSRIGIPERFYIQCIDSGWIARNHIPWVKPNAMPHSVTDRFTNVWESVFFFTKNSEPVCWHNPVTKEFSIMNPKGTQGELERDWEWVPCRKCNQTGFKDGLPCKPCKGEGKRKRSLWKSEDYYFNLNAVRETPKTEPKGAKKVRKSIQSNGKLFDGEDPKITKDSIQDKDSNVSRLHRDRDGNKNKQDRTLGVDGKPKPTYEGFNDRWAQKQINEDKLKEYLDNGSPNGNARIQARIAMARELGLDRDACLNHPNGKNPGDVFTIPVKPFNEAHFATFPIELPLKILKCSCPQEVCTECGLPRFPILEPSDEYKKLLGRGWHDHSDDDSQGQQQDHELPNATADYRITGWTRCNCKAQFMPGTVLDPFFGAGTTGLAAEMLGRNWVGIELKKEYVDDIILKRLEKHNNNRILEYT